MKSARAAGLAIPVIAAVAVFTDSVSAAVLEGLPGLELDPAVTQRVLSASDPVEAGIAAAVDEARSLLSIEGVEGVNVSGLGSASGPRIGAEIKAEVGRRIHDQGGGAP
jgi:5,10-methylenetetrahydrofolate reductase